MNDLGSWLGRLQEEIAKELGQTVSLDAAREAPRIDRCFADALSLPGARLVLAADHDDMAAFLVEARVIEAGQADADMVRELWSGILASVAAGCGGKAAPAGVPEENTQPWALRLGNATVRLSVALEAAGDAVRSQPEKRAAKETTEKAGNPAEVGTPATGMRSAGNFDLLLEVELDAAVRFGSRELELKELLELGPGDVVELDRQVADPVDLIVGDRIVARGEVVLVNGNFGLRVTEVAEPVRRLESIRCLW
jgi:flagellar motor switch protein FliN/FliY